MNADGDQGEFERRVSELLASSAESLDGATRSRLTQARYRALEQRAHPAANALAWRRWAPGGVAAVAVLIMLGLLSHPSLAPDQGANPVASNDSGAAMDDLDLLADNEAIELSQDEDYDFYEWAADAAGDNAVGS